MEGVLVSELWNLFKKTETRGKLMHLGDSAKPSRLLGVRSDIGWNDAVHSGTKVAQERSHSERLQWLDGNSSDLQF